ncbi:hypothetical protein FB45DRAFT_997896 [Roridomyces roridus]|uniref:Uncharacterized protein n=1 Tax=Roridomyces roridus TaxID=1738132 RepID=A0AAD7CL44_9AGAR|nr:hypothetical protein FB45DRAFT_997896 [Roridomyces roridus]
MDRDELCTTMHVSSSIRRVASLHLLFRLGISQSEIQAGTVKLALSDSLHLILFVAHILPIQRLECFSDTKDMQASDLQRLAPILGATADLVIHDKLKEWQRRTLDPIPLYLLTHLPQTATATLFIVVPRPSLPREWIIPDIEPGRILWLIFVGINLLCMLIDFIVSLGPVLYRLFGWSMERISKSMFSDPRAPWSGGEIHVQSLSMKHTLVLCKTAASHNPFFIQPLRSVPASVHAKFLASIDVQFTGVSVISGSNVTLAALATFVARQENLRTLTFEPYFIRRAPLVSASPIQPIPSKIVHLEAPASYIPHLLPLAPRVERVYLYCSSLPIWLPVLSRGSRVFDYTTYCTALDAIARLPGLHALALSLTFNPLAKSLPWQIKVSSNVPQPETQLHRVKHLMLCTMLPYFRVYSTSTLRALIPWLARFPSLRRVSFDGGAVNMWHDKLSGNEMAFTERCEMSEAIAAACPGISRPSDVVFQIAVQDRMGSGLG